jgi:hypothetical protein
MKSISKQMNKKYWNTDGQNTICMFEVANILLTSDIQEELRRVISI